MIRIVQVYLSVAEQRDSKEPVHKEGTNGYLVYLHPLLLSISFFLLHQPTTFQLLHQFSSLIASQALLLNELHLTTVDSSPGAALSHAHCFHHHLSRLVSSVHTANRSNCLNDRGFESSKLF